MACAICEKRRPRRSCPGVSGDICTLCCGTEREVSVDCPLDCEYLIEAHLHEKPLDLDLDHLPNPDVDVSRDWLEANGGLLEFLAHALERMAVGRRELIDFDLREALEAAIRTHRTMQTGLVFQSLPANPLAADVCRGLLEAVEEFRRLEYEELGVHRTKESAVLSALVFFQHMELSFNNGRRRGRAFVDGLLTYYPIEGEPDSTASSSLLLP